jgi:hypothetical protein
MLVLMLLFGKRLVLRCQQSDWGGFGGMEIAWRRLALLLSGVSFLDGSWGWW